jgi:hypothetical protein
MPESVITYPLSRRQISRDASGFGRACSACGHEDGTCGGLVISITGMRIGEEHFRDPADGFYGTPFSRGE